MLNSKLMTLKPLFESSGGIHLSVYLKNSGDLASFRRQIRESISEAYDQLTVVMSVEEKLKFLEPIESLFKKSDELFRTGCSMGIFLKSDFVYTLDIPVPVEHTCQIATTFHVRPLIKWLQGDDDFIFLAVEGDLIHLTLGSQHSFKLLETLPLPKCFKDRLNLTNKVDDSPDSSDFEYLTKFRDLIFDLTCTTRPKLYLAGDRSALEKIKRDLSYDRTVEEPIADSFTLGHLNTMCIQIRLRQQVESLTLLERTLAEFHQAEDRYKTRTNIYQIAKAVVQGRVRKLAIAEEVSVFGKLDRKTGKLSLHPFDLDHEDDDILDDLAQMVLLQGGDVILIPQTEIPNRRPILAIVDCLGQSPEASKDRYYDNTFKMRRA